MRFWLGLAVLVLSACNAGRIMEGSKNSTETASTVASEPVVDTSDIETEDTSETMASEPVSVGGAFLTCGYKSGQTQGSATYLMDCDVGPLAEVSSMITRAEFFKLDAKGLRTELTVTREDLTTLKWTLVETASTIPYTRVEVILSANNATPVSLSTSISTPIILTPTLSFWLGGEPNNLALGDAEGEDCVEFGNLAAKVDHQNRTGLTSGPYGRMNDIGCTRRTSSFLCRRLSADTEPTWLLSTFKGTFAQSAGACPDGYAFGFPITEKEINDVITLVDATSTLQNIWVNMSDRTEEGKFSAIAR